MFTLFALAAAAAAAAAAPPLTPDQVRNIRCVAVLGVIAFEQDRRTAAALALPPLAKDGARFAAVVGEGVVKESGRSQEQVRDLILAEVAAVQKGATLPVDEARGCVETMNAVVPPPPPPDPVRCAGLLKLTADEARRRDGMVKPTMDLLALAAALDNRARAELRAAGKSESESDRELGLAREALTADPRSAPDIEACLELARP